MMPKDNTERVIAFVCTGNTCRSPMAEGIFNQKAQEQGIALRAVSCGMAAVAGMPPSPNAVAVCREIGVDISEHRSRFLYDFQLGEFEKIYCMSQEHALILSQSVGVPPEKIQVLDIADPYGGSIEIYRMCRDMLVLCVEEILRAEKDAQKDAQSGAQGDAE